METESRIQYDDLSIKYNPHDQANPWELWIEGEFQIAAAIPRDLLELWASQSDRSNRYTDTERVPWHDRDPGEFETRREEVLPNPGMALDIVPSQDVQVALWERLREAEDEPEPIHLRDLCEDNELEYVEARRAVSLFSSRGLVEWGVSANVPWLTPEGKETDQPAWLDDTTDESPEKSSLSDDFQDAVDDE